MVIQEKSLKSWMTSSIVKICLIFFFQKNITLKIRNKPSRKLKAMNHSAYTIPVRLSLFLFFAIILYSCSDNDQLFDGGNGTEANPFQISTIEQLQAIGDEDNLNKHFIQVSNIDASSSVEFQDDRGFRPIGNEAFPFTGTYDGGGYEISGLVLDHRVDHYGLFGVLKNGQIRNTRVLDALQTYDKQTGMGIKQSNFSAPQEILIASDDFRTRGRLVGFNDGGQISDSHAIGTISSIDGALMNRTGVLVGYNRGQIEHSYAQGSGSALGGMLGGLVGGNSGSIKNSYASVSVSAAGTAGGLAGVNFDDGQIIKSYSTGNVTGNNTAGGLAGSNRGGRIYSSYATGEVWSIFRSGGLIGINDNGGEILQSYFLGKANGENDVGGITGWNQAGSMITSSFVAGEVTASAGQLTGDQGPNPAGIAGKNEGTTNDAYWDTETTGQSEGVGEGTHTGATGLTTEQMTGPAAEQYMPEFDWVNVWRTTEDGYPVLRWQDE